MARPAHSFVGQLALLTKARLGLLVTLTTVVGFVVASVGAVDFLRLFWTALGTTLAAFGANAFNQCIERERDGRMERTQCRPLPSGAMRLSRAVVVAAVLALGGDLILLALVNPLTAGLALLIQVLYLFVYTPLKPRTPANTLVGAVCGAIPPMMGWTAVRGQLEPGAWILFLILFVWQMPHFLSLAWLYKDDYERGGFRMLPSVDPSGMLTCNLVVLYTAALLPLAFATMLAGIAGWTFLVGATLLGLALLVLGLQLRESRERYHARRVFYASLLYLPALLGLLVFDRGPAVGPGPSFRMDEATASAEVYDSATEIRPDGTLIGSRRENPSGDGRMETTRPVASRDAAPIAAPVATHAAPAEADGDVGAATGAANVASDPSRHGR